MCTLNYLPYLVCIINLKQINMKKKVTHNAAGLGKKLGIGPCVDGLDMTKSPTWFRTLDSNIQGMVLGEEILIPLGMDFPLDLAGKPVVIVQHGKAPTVCKIIGIDELLQRVKIELFLEVEKTRAVIAAKTIFRIFEITWYCGADHVPKPVLSNGSVKFEDRLSIGYLKQPVTADEIKALESMEFPELS